jgi:TusA-related sulfurtransferase
MSAAKKPKLSDDVTFLVGPDQIPIKAHKMALAFNSKVFHTMFYGEFVEKDEDKISIDDITPDIFQQLVNSVHGEDVDLNTSNVIQVLYGAEKYDLKILKQLCVSFTENKLGEQNVLRFYSGCLPFNCAALVVEKCLAMILNNPIKYMETEDFLELSQDALIKIIKEPKINCTSVDIKKSITGWLRKNTQNNIDAFTEETYKLLETNLKLMKSDIEAKQLYEAHIIEEMPLHYASIEEVSKSFKINLKNLHGIGIVTGCRSENSSNVIVNIEIFNSKPTKTLIKAFSANIVMPVNKMLIQQIMFEKTLIKLVPGDELEVKLKFDYSKNQIKENANYRVVHTTPSGGYSSNFDTIAYLICSEME